MINWCDLFVLLVVGGFGIIGLKNGFVYSIFRLASFFVSIAASVKFYPKVAEILMKAGLYTSVKASILKSLLSQQSELIPKADGAIKDATADTIINRLQLPSFFKDIVVDRIPKASTIIDAGKVMDIISSELAKIAIDIISLILIYILIRIALVFVRLIFQGVAKLPVFKQMDKLGGFAFGAVEGMMTVYILFAVIIIFNAAPQLRPVFEMVDSSSLARFFYQNNFVIEWMFPGI
jgi:uncharacterized membrane protein required for colicin V production